MSRKSTSPAVDGNSLGEAEQANAGVVHHALHSLTEADALLHEGVRRIMAASSDLPEASHPLEEALRLTETQAMATLEAVENGFSEIAAIRATHGGFIDDRLDRLELQFHTILASQQGQDLARIPMKVTKLSSPQEKMSISFENTKGNSTEMHVKWENTDASVAITAQ